MDPSPSFISTLTHSSHFCFISKQVPDIIPSINILALTAKRLGLFAPEPTPLILYTKVRTKNTRPGFVRWEVTGHLCPRAFSALVGAEPGLSRNDKVEGMPVPKARLSFKKSLEGLGTEECSTEGHWAQVIGYILETAVAPQDVAPGLADQHAVHGQHMQPHLEQDILQPTS